MGAAQACSEVLHLVVVVPQADMATTLTGGGCLEKTAVVSLAAVVEDAKPLLVT